MTTIYKKGDWARYNAQSNPNWPVLAKVQRRHRDDSYTIQAWFDLDPATGDQRPKATFLGYKYRIAANHLYAAPKACPPQPGETKMDTYTATLAPQHGGR